MCVYIFILCLHWNSSHSDSCNWAQRLLVISFWYAHLWFMHIYPINMLSIRMLMLQIFVFFLRGPLSSKHVSRKWWFAILVLVFGFRCSLGILPIHLCVWKNNLYHWMWFFGFRLKSIKNTTWTFGSLGISFRSYKHARTHASLAVLFSTAMDDLNAKYISRIWDCKLSFVYVTPHTFFSVRLKYFSFHYYSFAPHHIAQYAVYFQFDLFLSRSYSRSPHICWLYLW